MHRIDYIIITLRVPICKDFKGIHNIKIPMWLYLLILLAKTKLCLYSIVKMSYFPWFNPIRHCTQSKASVFSNGNRNKAVRSFNLWFQLATKTQLIIPE